MFTGIVTDIGEVIEINGTDDLEITISCNYDLESITIGTSIAHNGICLTVTEKGFSKKMGWYKVNISKETMSKTNVLENGNGWTVGSELNLERSLKIGDELGGHIVTGHIDGIAEVINLEEAGGSTKISLQAPAHLIQFIAEKGSVTLNGTSLTINNVKENTFDVNLIPHTKKVTTWNSVKISDKINIEIDVLARYVGRINEMNSK